MSRFITDDVTGERLLAFELLPLDSDQISNIAAYDENPGDAEQLAIAVDSIATKQAYDDSLQSILSNMPSKMPGVGGVFINTMLAAQQIIYSTSVAGGEKVSVQFTRSVNERVAAYALLDNDILRNIPPSQLLNEMNKILEQILEHDPSMEFMDEFRNYATSLFAIKGIQYTLRDVPAHTRKERKGLGELESENNGLFWSVRNLQKYGIKSSYVKDGTQLPIEDWHIFDWQDTARHQLLEDPDDFVSARRLSLARFDGFTSSLMNAPHNYQKLYINNQEQIALDYSGIVQGKPDQGSPDIRFDLYEDGHLYGIDSVSISWFASELGYDVQYELIRARAISLFADMVIPAHLIDESSDIVEAESRIKNTEKAKTSNFLDLILARKRLIQLNPDIEEVADKEARDTTKTLRRHGVVGFIRKLPRGHRASQLQRELCRRDQGIELADNGETYVRGHVRGGDKSHEVSTLEIEGHRARIRVVGGSIIDQSFKN